MSFHTNSNITASMLMTRNSSGFGGSVWFNSFSKVSGDKLHTLELFPIGAVYRCIGRLKLMIWILRTEARSPLSFSRRKDRLASQIILEADCCGQLRLAVYLFESYLQVTPR